MKNGFSFLVGMGLSATFLIMAQSCTKSQATGGSSADASTTSASSTIAVSVDSAGTDSVYLMQDCGSGNYRDTIAASALPPGSAAYLDSAYSGYSMVEAYEIKDSAGAVKGYVAVIRYKGIPVGVLFNADGGFESVLEQRERGDMHGRGYHEGGRYGNRDGRQRDTVALTSLPSAIRSYFSSDFPGDTLQKAYENIDSSYLVISKDSVLYATLFSSAGTFISRTEIHARRHTSIAAVKATALPAAATTYLTDKYPNYVFEKEYAYSENGTLAGYLVFIDASNSKYAVEFDASGNFIGAITLF